MIRLIGLRQSREFVGMCIPVKITAIYNGTSHTSGMSIHVFRSRMCHDVCSPFKRTAVNRSSKSIIHNQRHSVSMGNTGKFLNIEHIDTRIRDCFTEQTFSIRTESLFYFFFRSIRINKSTLNTQFLHRYSEQIECTSINGRRADKMVACLANIKYGIEVSSLTR